MVRTQPRSMCCVGNKTLSLRFIHLLEDLQDSLRTIEMKHGLSASPRRGFYNAREEFKPARSFVVYSGEDRFPVTENIEAIGLPEMARLLVES